MLWSHSTTIVDRSSAPRAHRRRGLGGRTQLRIDVVHRGEHMEALDGSQSAQCHLGLRRSQHLSVNVVEYQEDVNVLLLASQSPDQHNHTNMPIVPGASRAAP